MTLDVINVLPESIRVILMAVIPFGELRASIPFAIGIYEMDPREAFVLSVIGNMLPVVPLLLFLDQVSNWLRRYNIFDRFFNWLFSRTRRYNNRIEKYGSLGLIPFVAIPLPVTGAWTACAVAFVFGIRCRYAFAAIFAGVIIAGIVVTLSYMGVLVIIEELISVYAFASFSQIKKVNGLRKNHSPLSPLLFPFSLTTHPD